MQFCSSGFVADFDVIFDEMTQHALFGRTGGYSVRSDDHDDYIAKQFSPITTVNTAFAWYSDIWIPDGTNTNGLWTAFKGATRLARIQFNASAQLEAYVGSTLVGTGATAFATDAHYHIEVEYQIGASGVFKVWVDGILEINFSGNTQPDANTDFDEIRFYPAPVTGVSGRAGYISDIVIQDTGRIYNARVAALLPNAAGDINQWTGVYTDIDEYVHDGDTTKITSASAGQTALFNVANLPAAANTVSFVQVSGHVRQDGTPPDQVKWSIKTGGTQYDSAAFSLTTNYARKPHLWDENPNTLAEWTVAEVNNLQIGATSA